MDHRTDMGDLLRKAMVITRKLKLRAMSDWCSSELNGYDDYTKVLSYRVLEGEVKVYNPYNGI